jgi:catechol 2,3-dioxygenase-like lactoylglutathione lyase family enzyme
MNRRDALRVLGTGAIAAHVRAADSPFRFTRLDHIETNAPNALKTAEFYARMFGGPIWKNKKTERRYVRLGPCYIAIENGREPYGVDHFSAGIADYAISEIHQFLEKRGIPYRDYPSGKDLNVTDPDGIHVQLSADNTWGPLAENTAAPEPGTFDGEPMFRPTGIDHVLLNVTDLARSKAFYETIFGPAPGTRFRVGRSSIMLMRNATAGVARIGVTASSQADLVDPDGLKIQVDFPAAVGLA